MLLPIHFWPFGHQSRYPVNELTRVLKEVSERTVHVAKSYPAFRPISQVQKPSQEIELELKRLLKYHFHYRCASCLAFEWLLWDRLAGRSAYIF